MADDDLDLPLPPNVHVSRHPCLRAKLSQLRSQSTNSRDTNALVRDIASIVGVEALGQCLEVSTDGAVSDSFSSVVSHLV